MSIFDKLELGTQEIELPKGQCPHSIGTQKVLVAYSHVSGSTWVLSASCGARFDIQECGIDAEDIFYGHDFSPGLSVWEGEINTISEDDVAYEGSWRSVSDTELQAFQQGTDLFLCKVCDGTGSTGYLEHEGIRKENT